MAPPTPGDAGSAGGAGSPVAAHPDGGAGPIAPASEAGAHTVGSVAAAHPGAGTDAGDAAAAAVDEDSLEALKERLRREILKEEVALMDMQKRGPCDALEASCFRVVDRVAHRAFLWPRLPVLLFRLGVLAVTITFFTALFLVVVSAILEIVLTQAQTHGVALLGSLAVAHILTEATAKLFCLVSSAALTIAFTGDRFTVGAAHEVSKIDMLAARLEGLRRRHDELVKQATERALKKKEGANAKAGGATTTADASSASAAVVVVDGSTPNGDLKSGGGGATLSSGSSGSDAKDGGTAGTPASQASNAAAEEDAKLTRLALRIAAALVLTIGACCAAYDAAETSLDVPPLSGEKPSNHAVYAVEWALNWLPMWVAIVVLVAAMLVAVGTTLLRLVSLGPVLLCRRDRAWFGTSCCRSPGGAGGCRASCGACAPHPHAVRLATYLFTPSPHNAVKEVRSILVMHGGFTLMLVLVGISVVHALALEDSEVFPSEAWHTFRNVAVAASVIALGLCYLDTVVRTLGWAHDSVGQLAGHLRACCGRPCCGGCGAGGGASAAPPPAGATAPTVTEVVTDATAAPKAAAAGASKPTDSGAPPDLNRETVAARAVRLPRFLPCSLSDSAVVMWARGVNGALTFGGAIYLLALLCGVGMLAASHASKALCMCLAVMVGVNALYPTPREGCCSFLWRILVLCVSMAFFALSMAYGTAGGNQTHWTPVKGAAPLPPAQDAAYPVCGLTVNSLTITEHCLMTAAAYSDAGNATAAFHTWFPNGSSVLHPGGGWALEDLSLDASAPRYIHLNHSSGGAAVFIRGTSTSDDWLHDANLWLEPAVLQLSGQLSPTAIFSTRVLHRAVSLVDALVTALTQTPGRVPEVVARTLALVGRVKASAGGGQVTVSGHSLGGGLASISAGHYGLESVSFSGPGWVLSSGKLGVSLANATARARRETVIIPDADVVPRIDRHQGNVQFIQCSAGLDPGACHGLVRTCCELLRVCGDPMGRSLSTCAA